MKKFFTAAVAMLLIGFATLQAQIPSFQLKDINGKTVDTAKLSNDGKPIIISFFATWCHPCLRELSNISEVYEDWQDETLRVSSMKCSSTSIPTLLVLWAFKTFRTSSSSTAPANSSIIISDTRTVMRIRSTIM